MVTGLLQNVLLKAYDDEAMRLCEIGLLFGLVVIADTIVQIGNLFGQQSDHE